MTLSRRDAEREIREVKQEIKKYKAGMEEARSQKEEMEAKIAGFNDLFTAMGVDDPADMEQVAALRDRLRARNAETRMLRIESAFAVEARHEAVDHGFAFPLLESLGRFDHLDPDSPSFDRDLISVMRTAVQQEPKLGSGLPKVPRRSSGLFGGTGLPPAEPIDADALDGMTPAAIDAARLDGRLDGLIGE